MTDEQWIVIRNWNRYQHYTDRNPPWIKNHLDLLHNDGYLELTAHQRAVLHGLWLIYASAHCQVRVNTLSLTRQLGIRVSSRQLEALNHAGFIDFVASKPLAIAREREAETETERLFKDERTLSRAREIDDVEELFEHAEETLEPLGAFDELWRPNDPR